jgi:hypothetical protein
MSIHLLDDRWVFIKFGLEYLVIVIVVELLDEQSEFMNDTFRLRGCWPGYVRRLGLGHECQVWLVQSVSYCSVFGGFVFQTWEPVALDKDSSVDSELAPAFVLVSDNVHI